MVWGYFSKAKWGFPIRLQSQPPLHPQRHSLPTALPSAASPCQDPQASCPQHPPPQPASDPKASLQPTVHKTRAQSPLPTILSF